MTALRSLPDTSRELLNQIEVLCERLLLLGLSELKAGGLRPLIAEIQQILLETDSEWAGRVYLTRLLLYIANVTSVVQQFEVITFPASASSSVVLFPTSRPVGSPILGRRPSVVSLSSPGGSSPTPTKELEPFSAMVALSSIPQSESAESTEEDRNVFVETDLAGLVQYISPFSEEILGLVSLF